MSHEGFIRRFKLRGPTAGGTSVLHLANQVPIAAWGTLHRAVWRIPSDLRIGGLLVVHPNDHPGGYFPHSLEPAA